MSTLASKPAFDTESPEEGHGPEREKAGKTYDDADHMLSQLPPISVTILRRITTP